MSLSRYLCRLSSEGYSVKIGNYWGGNVRLELHRGRAERQIWISFADLAAAVDSDDYMRFHLSNMKRDIEKFLESQDKGKRKR